MTPGDLLLYTLAVVVPVTVGAALLLVWAAALVRVLLAGNDRRTR